MISSMFLVLQAFYFAWATKHGVNMIDTSDLWQYFLLFIPNAALVVLYGASERMKI